MLLTRRSAGFLLAVGVWTWAIWPNFLRAIWRDDRSWNDGPTAFFVVHLALVTVSLAIGSAVGWIGWRGLRPLRDGRRSPRLRDGRRSPRLRDGRSGGRDEPVRSDGTEGPA